MTMNYSTNGGGTRGDLSGEKQVLQRRVSCLGCCALCVCVAFFETGVLHVLQTSSYCWYVGLCAAVVLSPSWSRH